MAEREVIDGVEVIPDRLYWTSLQMVPKNSSKFHYFCIDHNLVYEPFSSDFGPLNLSMVHRYCTMLEAKMMDPQLGDKRIVHYCVNDPKKRANAAFLICAYQVTALGVSAELAYEPFKQIHAQFLPFRDASCGACSFHLTILDCLKGLEISIANKWFDWRNFDVDSCEFFDKVDHGDMNWIIPDKFLAFAGPHSTSCDTDGFLTFTPEDYVPIFREAGIGLVVRLNKKQYDRRRFIDLGIKHVDLYFLDGSCPSREIIAKFMHIAESEPGGIAIHCKAGLGRTGTLIGLYAMKHYHMPAKAFIGWNRICRPGSILGPQQQFLLDMEYDMFQAGAIQRGPSSPLSAAGADSEAQQAGARGPSTPLSAAGADTDRILAQQVERLNLRDRCQAEQVEDTGQGERLCNAKRSRPSSKTPVSGAGALPLEIVLPPVGGSSAAGGAREASPSSGVGRIHPADMQDIQRCVENQARR